VGLGRMGHQEYLRYQQYLEAVAEGREDAVPRRQVLFRHLALCPNLVIIVSCHIEVNIQAGFYQQR